MSDKESRESSNPPVPDSPKTGQAMSDQGSRDSSNPEQSPRKPRRQVQIPARFLDSHECSPIPDSPKTGQAMSDEGSRESSNPEQTPRKPRRQVQIPARFRDSHECSPAPESPTTGGGRGRPPSKQLSSQPPAIVVDDIAPTPPPPPSQLKGKNRALGGRVGSAGTGNSTPTESKPLAAGSNAMGVRRQVARNVPFGGGTKRVAYMELSDPLKENLTKLKSLLKLPTARRWLYSEFFYSAIDEELLLAENEFSSMLEQAFPNLMTRRLTKTEWRTVRRLIGKPRRCSQAFFEEERAALELRRIRIRNIYDGANLASLDPNTDFCDLPAMIPRQFVVGMRVFARVKHPKDGLYTAHIDAVMQSGYRVTFVKDHILRPMFVPDTELIPETKMDLVPIAYFAALSSSVLKFGQSSYISNQFLPERQRPASAIGIPPPKKIAIDLGREGKVGNFPARLLVIVVKLTKLIEHKKMLVGHLTEMNDEAEKINLVMDSYSHTFQKKYASILTDLEEVNRMIQTYMTGIQDYHPQLLPYLTEMPVTSKPEALRKLCFTHSKQIVKHCNNGLNVQNKHALGMITTLTSLLLQVRSLGQQRCSPLDLNTLNESLKEIQEKISPQNRGAFQDLVEVHMKQIHDMMLAEGGQRSEVSGV